MSGLKQFNYKFQQAKVQITPDEIDSYRQMTITNPSTSTTWFGTVAPGTVAGTFVIDNAYPDVPRNFLASVVGPAGGVGGTFTVYGKNQFGVTQNESVTIGSANGGGSAAGTLVFGYVGSASYSPNGVDNTGTPRLGVAIGTAAGLVHKFGLLDKIASTTDVKLFTWINNGTPTTLPSTWGTLVTVSDSSVRGTAIVALTDRYQITYKTTKDLSNQANQAGL